MNEAEGGSDRERASGRGSGTRQVKSKKLKLALWDTAGQERSSRFSQ